MLQPVNISCLAGKPEKVGSNKDHASSDDDEQRLQSFVMTQALSTQTLHPLGVVFLSASLAQQVGMVNCIQHLGQIHL